MKTKRNTLKSNSYVKIPAALLDMKQSGILSGNELTVCVFLLSIHAAVKAVKGFRGIQVSQERIAMSCGIGTARTVGNIIRKLSDLNLLQVFRDEWNGRRHSNVYVIEEPLLDLSGGFFYIPRRIFKKGLPPKLLLIYFLLCHTQNYEYSRSWNSYSDIARRVRMNRADVILYIKKLERAGYITKNRRIIKKCGKGAHYADNRYTVIWLALFTEKNSGHVTDRRSFSIKGSHPFYIFCRKIRTNIKGYFSNLHYNNYNTKLRACQVITDKKSEYELSVALQRMEEIEREQLRLPTASDIIYKPHFYSIYEGFPF